MDRFFNIAFAGHRQVRVGIVVDQLAVCLDCKLGLESEQKHFDKSVCV